MKSFQTIHRLKIAQRFIASVCFFSLPMGMLLYFNMEQIADKIAFARQEVTGNHFQRPAVRLIGALADYQTGFGSQSVAAGSNDTGQKVEDLLRQHA
ncbi:MAG TPA: hypothetical protein VMZ30_00385 [Pyrinomonadaceae bacterium]|nr:hypothetical protein [Pyrinomonadaceae bacterium]